MTHAQPTEPLDYIQGCTLFLKIISQDALFFIYKSYPRILFVFYRLYPRMHCFLFIDYIPGCTVFYSVSKILVHETVETFLFLFFIELSQLLLIMGFYDACTLDCIINKTEIVIALNGLLSFSKIIWRFSTRWEYCTFRRLNTKTLGRDRNCITPIFSPGGTGPLQIPNQQRIKVPKQKRQVLKV